jgi:cholesterol transport system auxiliary component
MRDKKSQRLPMIDRAMTVHGLRHLVRQCLGWLGLAVLLGGCAGLRPPQVENGNMYVLEAKPIAKIARARRDIVVEVSAPRASPGFETPRIAYVQRPYELDYFANNQWADAPPRMLGPILAQALEQSGSFSAVVQAPSIVAPDVRVVSELLRLQQNFETRPSRMEITLRVQLIDVRSRRLLATRVLEATENAPSDDPYGGVTAANIALQRILDQFADFCIVESASAEHILNTSPLPF